ncbi:MAG: VTT domain-containing protein [Candidatus Pacebacteria bacterium]|nr:VTT domain-containing protein [Candidatus Paceibacterota bacterium]
MDQTISLIIQYKYLIIFPLVVIEGPILTVICGFFITSGFLNFLPTFLLVIIGDIIGDSFYYGLGRWGEKYLDKFKKIFKINEKNLLQAKTYFNSHRKKALFFSKLLHGLGFTGLIAAGNLKIPYRQFFITCFFITLIQSSIFFIIGFFFGNAYLEIGKYLDYYSSALIIGGLLFILYIIIKKLKL